MTKGHCESSLGSFDELQNSAQVAVDPQTKPPDLGCESACRLLSSTATIALLVFHTGFVFYRCAGFPVGPTSRPRPVSAKR